MASLRAVCRKIQRCIMPQVFFWAREYAKNDITRALEAGVDGLVVPSAHAAEAAALSRAPVYAPGDFVFMRLQGKADEAKAAAALAAGRNVVLESGWQVIPVENLLAARDPKPAHGTPFTGILALEVSSADEARLASGILERGVPLLLVSAAGLGQIEQIVREWRYTPPSLQLAEAEIVEVYRAGLGHRVCVDTLSILKNGQGMLAGNSPSFTFLVQAETGHNEYVAARPFRINAGAVHSYTLLPRDLTCYLEELQPAAEVLIVDAQGLCRIAAVGRIKIEQRPMLMIKARHHNGQEGTIFLQDAETVRLTASNGQPLSVATLQPGGKVLCHLDSAGRHFGMRIQEDIKEG